MAPEPTATAVDLTISVQVEITGASLAEREVIRGLLHEEALRFAAAAADAFEREGLDVRITGLNG